MSVDFKMRRTDLKPSYRLFHGQFCALLALYFLVVSCLLAGLGSQAQADPVDGSLLQVLEGPQANDLLSKIELAFRQKCSNQRSGCSLVEADILAGGALDRILIFRGESTNFSTPLTSSLFRWIHTQPDFLTNFRSSSKITDFVYSRIRADLAPSDNFIAATRFFETSARNEKSPRSKFRILSSNHLSLEGLRILDDATSQKFIFDPFISFSLNPAVALEYTRRPGQPVPYRTARFYVASVPKAKFVLLSGKACDVDSPLDPSLIYDINKCAHGDNASDSEGERDATLYLPAEYLRWVIGFDETA